MWRDVSGGNQVLEILDSLPPENTPLPSGCLFWVSLIEAGLAAVGFEPTAVRDPAPVCQRVSFEDRKMQKGLWNSLDRRHAPVRFLRKKTSHVAV